MGSGARAEQLDDRQAEVGTAVTFVDLAGVTRMKCVPAARAHAATSSGVGMSVLWSASQGDDAFAAPPGLEGPSGDMRLVGDASAKRPIPTAPGWSWIPANQMRQDGRPWEGCPRQFAKAMVERLEGLGLRLLTGFELEWTLFEAASPAEPLHRRPSFAASTFPLLHEYFADLIVASEATRVGIEQIHPEHAPGQVEASLRATDPVAACDETVIFRLMAALHAEQRGLRASFSPLPLAGEVGNGQHLHFSLWSGDNNLFSRTEPTGAMHSRGASFLSGVLANLPALTALGASSPVSYLRLRPSTWSGAYACWGLENREASLRLEGFETPTPVAANVEWKSVDPSANPYLAMGGLIAAGLDGLERGLLLPPSIDRNPASLSVDERGQLGIHLLPASLAEAARVFARSELLRDAMGAFLHGCVTAVRAGEAATSAAADADLINSYRFRY